MTGVAWVGTYSLLALSCFGRLIGELRLDIVLDIEYVEHAFGIDGAHLVAGAVYHIAHHTGSNHAEVSGIGEPVGTAVLEDGQVALQVCAHKFIVLVDPGIWS